MGRCKDHLIRFIVLGALICGFAFNLWVGSSCEFLESPGQTLEIGIFHYSLNLPGSEFHTGGECERFEDRKADDGYVRTAQVCAVLAPIFGLILIILITLNQCCCPIPCSGIIVSLSYTGTQICTALIWLVHKTDLCDVTGCDWGQAASGNVLAQIMYFIAAVFHKCMPSPKESAAIRKADAAEKKAAEAEKRQKEAEATAKEAEDKMHEAEAKIEEGEASAGAEGTGESGVNAQVY